jgi:hypothetical protein
MTEQNVADLTLARVNVAIAKLDTVIEGQREQIDRLSAIESRIARLEVYIDVRELP